MLNSPNPEIQYEAVRAAGNWEWMRRGRTWLSWQVRKKPRKELRLAAIEAVAGIRPEEAADILSDLVDSPDEDIAEAADEALSMAEGALDSEYDDEDDEDEEDEDDDEDDEDEEDEDDDEDDEEDGKRA